MFHGVLEEETQSMAVAILPGGKTPHPASRPPSPLTTGEKGQDESDFQSRAPLSATLLILNPRIAEAQKHRNTKGKSAKRYFFIRFR